MNPANLLAQRRGELAQAVPQAQALHGGDVLHKTGCAHHQLKVAGDGVAYTRVPHLCGYMD